MGDDIFNQYFNLDGDNLGGESQVAEKTQTVTQRPSMYNIVILNDDFTPIDFVVVTLKMFFGKNDTEAQTITSATHNDGKAVCGTYTRDVAETKLSQVINFSRSNGYPLKYVMSKDL